MLLYSFAQITSKIQDFLFPLSGVSNVVVEQICAAPTSTREWLWLLWLWLWPVVHKFPPFEFYCFIMKRKPPILLFTLKQNARILVNDHFDDLYGAALNLPISHRLKKGEKAVCLAVVFDELFGGGSPLWWFEAEADFLRTFLCEVFDCHCVLAPLYLPFNKCVTPARLAFYNIFVCPVKVLKFKTSVWFKSMA